VIRQARSLPILRVLAVLVVLALLAGGYGIWYLFFRPSGPPPVGSTNLPAASLGSIAAPASADGTWTVDTDIGSIADGTASSIDLKATRQGGMITITGSMPIVFADFNIQKPVSFIVLSVDDHGVMELQLHFVHA